MIADVVVDLQYGDCGKGKVAHHLLNNNHYTHVIRYNGGCNAGHTIFHGGKKFITHHIPCGVFYGIKSIIGPGCDVNPKKFFEEIENLEANGIVASQLVKIAENAHVITDFHLAQDGKDEEIGTTKRGNGPAYRDKYARRGIRACDVPELEPFLVDMYEELYEDSNPEKVEILFEGAQGFGLDIDWGDYPYVTSSHCTVGSAILNGVPPRCIRDIYGVAKVYETYVGAKEFEGDDPIFDLIRAKGEEYGSTTGRPRQINWMDFDLLKMAIRINGVNKLILNKTDILDELESWTLYNGDTMYEFKNGEDFQYWIETKAKEVNPEIQTTFSSSKYAI